MYRYVIGASPAKGAKGGTDIVRYSACILEFRAESCHADRYVDVTSRLNHPYVGPNVVR